MGILLNKISKEKIILRLNSSLGRSIHNTLVMPDLDISKSHASLYWVNNDWFVKDHSSNGTLLNGELIIHQSKKLKKGDILQFGKNETSIFQLNESCQPKSYFRNKQDKKMMITLDEASHYPSDNPQVSFFKLNNQSWCIDNGEQEKILVDGTSYFFCDGEWVFFENQPIEDTILYSDTQNRLTFEFSLSSDHENISLALSNKETKYDLGKRTHNHLLLILAREKQDAIEAKDNQNLSGWITMENVMLTLKKELMLPSIDQYYVNIMIHRIRKQFSTNLPFKTNMSDLIERDNGKLRFRYENIKINVDEVD